MGGAAASLLLAHLAVLWARSGELDSVLLAVDGALVLLALAAAFVHVQQLGRERRRQVLLQELATAFSVPRDIDDTARSAVMMLTAAGVAPVALVAVSRDAGGEPAEDSASRGALAALELAVAGQLDRPAALEDSEESEPPKPPEVSDRGSSALDSPSPVAVDGDGAVLVPVARAGFPDGADMLGDPFALDGALGVPVSAFPGVTVRRESTTADRWLRPVGRSLGDRPWVARVPVERGDELLGALVLVTRDGRSLEDRAMLRLVASLLGAALDNARMYEASSDQARDLEAQDGRRREFLYAISHELRTPLTSIRAFTELLAEGFGTNGRARRLRRADEEELVGSLRRGVDRLSGLVDDLLSLGRMEEVPEDVALVPLDVAEALRGAEALLLPAFLQRQQAFEVDLPSGSLWAMAEQRTLDQVVVNLLSNANRHTPVGGSVALRASQSGERIEIEVEDSGPGIAPEDRERVFEPFFRVRRAGVAQVPGSGLGLAVARRSIEQLHGRIWVEAATSGSGSRFCVELPVTGEPPRIASVERDTAEVPPAPPLVARETAETEADRARQLRLDLHDRRIAGR